MIIEPPGRTSGQERLAVPEQDRRRHRAARPLARRRQVRIGRGALRRGEVEISQLVVEQEPTARHDHGVAADLLDRQRVLHDVAPPVGDREVGGPRSLVAPTRAPRWRMAS